MINLGIESNLGAFEQALVRYAEETGKTNKEALHDQGRLLMVRMVSLTPPKNQKQGRDAMRKDVERSAPLQRPDDFRSEQLQALIREGRYSIVNEILREAGSPTRFVPFDKTNHLAAHATPRKRVSRRRDFREQTIGPEQETRRERYLRKLSQSSGRAKGGWAHSLIKLGGKAPSWISRHEDAGQLEDQSGHPTDPYLRFINESGWAGLSGEDASPQRIIDIALRTRARNIAQDLRRRHARALRAQLGRASRTGRKALA